LRPGEIKIEGLGKRYWIGSGPAGRDDVEAFDGGEDEPELEIEDGGTFSFFGRRTELWALRQINCQISPGERVAIIGANGSGKSTLIRILSRTLPPSEGRVEGAGVVVPFAAFKSPLSPQMSGCDNLRMLARLLEIPHGRLEERLPQIIEFSELGQLANENVSRYSDGSYARLSSAMGLLIDADIFLVDDSLKFGDEAYREKFEAKFREILQRRATLIYASNALGILRQYCQRALWLERGRLAGDGEVATIIGRFLSRSQEAAEFDDLVGPGDAPDAQANVPVPDEAKLATEGELDTTRSPIPQERLQPLQEWRNEVKRAEDAWEQVLRRWREKVRPQDARNMGRLTIDKRTTLGTIQTLWCLNSEGRPIRRCLPGEGILVELVVETFEANVKVAVRLELDVIPVLAWVAEPLVPLLASEPGTYLFRTAIDGGFSAHSYENFLLKLRTRVLFEKSNVNCREMIAATVHIDMRGDVRAQFDQQRAFAGDPPTSILDPAPAYVEQPTEIAGFDEIAEPSPSIRTRWYNLSRRPVLRPRLQWMIYRVAEPLPPPALEEAPEPAVEQASS
jgi:ABC-type polysaccharide/polyol phosphate transport system ATPase subunit